MKIKIVGMQIYNDSDDVNWFTQHETNLFCCWLLNNNIEARY